MMLIFISEWAKPDSSLFPGQFFIGRLSEGGDPSASAGGGSWRLGFSQCLPDLGDGLFLSDQFLNFCVSLCALCHSFLDVGFRLQIPMAGNVGLCIEGGHPLGGLGPDLVRAVLLQMN